MYIYIFIVTISSQQKKDSKKASIVMRGSLVWLTLISLKPKWMIIQAWEYVYILQESFTTCYHGYELLKRFSDIFQSYLVINQLTLVIYQQRVTCLELAHIFRLRFRLSIILYRLKLLALVDYPLVQYPQHSYEKNPSIPVRLNKSIF